MTHETKHTPAPWKLGASKTTVVGGEGDYAIAACATQYPPDESPEANAAHIVRCVNSYKDLLYALENITDHYHSKDGDMKLMRHFIAEADKAIAKARGE